MTAERGRREFPVIIRRVRRGEPPRASHQNELIDSVNRRTEGVDARPSQRADSRQSIEAPEIGRFRLKTVKGDYLVCRTWNGSDEGDDDVFVAKPFILRESLTEHGAFTFGFTTGGKRVADDGTDTETQIVVPSYETDDEIVAIRGIGRGTGVRTATGQRVEWLDMNIDARMWAREPD